MKHRQKEHIEIDTYKQAAGDDKPISKPPEHGWYLDIRLKEQSRKSKQQHDIDPWSKSCKDLNAAVECKATDGKHGQITDMHTAGEGSTVDPLLYDGIENVDHSNTINKKCKTGGICSMEKQINKKNKNEHCQRGKTSFFKFHVVFRELW